MIHKVWLSKWKAYDSLELNLNEGTTFLIAENGVGKSSIVQALYFALFGSEEILGTNLSVANAVRGPNGTIGTVGCELSIDKNAVRLERSVEKSSRRSAVSTSVEINGQRVPETQWLNLIRVSTDVDAAQLSLLAFVSEGATISYEDAGPSTVEMLSEVFGVDRLRRAARQCELVAKRLNRDNDSMRKGLRDVPARKDAEQVLNLEEETVRVKEQLDFVKAKLIVLERFEKLQQEWAKYEVEKVNFHAAAAADQQRASAILSEAREILGNSFDVETREVNHSELEQVTRLLMQRYEDLLSERGRLEAQRVSAEQQISLLGTDTPLCPTCRQPLAPEAAKIAIAEHAEVIRKSRSELSKTEKDLSLLRRLTENARDLLRVPATSPPAPPSETPSSVSDAEQSDISQVRSEYSRLKMAIEDNENRLSVTRQVAGERKQNALLSARLFEGYRAAERSQLAADTMGQLADAICAERITPMANEIQKRWPMLSIGSQLHMDSSGKLSVEEGGHVISYGNLSGGQRTLAKLTVRLLALQMATRCSFLVLDEPLEHLDARNRRSLATLLVNATRDSSQLRQVLVTTYEESVTRRLSSAPISDDSSKGEARAAEAHIIRIATSRQRQES